MVTKGQRHIIQDPNAINVAELFWLKFWNAGLIDFLKIFWCIWQLLF